MSTTIPTEQAIRVMDGETLTQLAYTLGLSPDDVQYVDDKKSGWWRGETYQGVFIPLQRWHPHDDLAQAREVFLDKLDSYGWTVSYWRHGDVNVLSAHAEARYDVYQKSVGDEAHGLLLCACLARAAQLRDAMT